MKKFITTLLAVFYLVTTSGATVHMHYCMGELASLSLSKNIAPSCAVCGMEKKEQSGKDCCKDDHKVLKDDSAQKLAENNLQMVKLVSIAIPASFTQVPTDDFPTITVENQTRYIPSRSYGVPIYIFKQTFLI